MTEDCHLNRDWPEAGDPATPEERLRAILLAIRRMAAQQLGASHGRPNDWLEEYYFLLAVLRAVHRPVREPPASRADGGPDIGGCCDVAAELAQGPQLPRTRCLDGSVARLIECDPLLDAEEDGHEPADILGGTDPGNALPQLPPTPGAGQGPEPIGRPGETDQGVDAVGGAQPEISPRARRRPGVRPGAIECGEHDRSELALRALEITFANLDEEILCRWGRLFKDRGDDYLELPGAVSDRFAPNRDRAVEFYRKALEKYDEAYGIRSGHYPGINKATLLLIVGSLKAEQTGQAPGASPPRELLESVDLAGKLLENRGSWTSDQPYDEPVWHPATQGEAHLLRREWAQAAALYREAMGAREISHLARESMRRQVDRILLAFRNLGIAIPPPFDDAAAFFARDRRPPREERCGRQRGGPVAARPGTDLASRAGRSRERRCLAARIRLLVKAAGTGFPIPIHAVSSRSCAATPGLNDGRDISMTYQPTPIPTRDVVLPDALLELSERLAENTTTCGPASPGRRVDSRSQARRRREDTSVSRPLRRPAGIGEGLRPRDGDGDAQGHHRPGIPDRPSVVRHGKKIRSTRIPFQHEFSEGRRTWQVTSVGSRPTAAS